MTDSKPKKVTNTIAKVHKVWRNDKELPPFNDFQYCQPDRLIIYVKNFSRKWEEVDCPSCHKKRKKKNLEKWRRHDRKKRGLNPDAIPRPNAKKRKKKKKKSL